MHDTITLAASYIDIGQGLGADLKDLIFNYGIPILCGLFVLVVGWKTKAPGPTIMAVIFAGIVWGLSANMSSLKDSTTDTINQYDDGTTTPMGTDQ